jgi:hypothetical protein
VQFVGELSVGITEYCPRCIAPKARCQSTTWVIHVISSPQRPLLLFIQLRTLAGTLLADAKCRDRSIALQRNT